MNYFFAGLIVAVWIFLVEMLCWKPKISNAHNILSGLLFAVVLGLIHWVPFWLIFLY